METFTSKEQLAAKLREQITTKDNQAIKALRRIYEYQTQHEKSIGETCEYNGVGFNGMDAKVLSSFAKLSYKTTLTEKQMMFLKNHIGKYAMQLVNQSIAKGLIRKEGKNYVWDKR